jgi:hypothetical protein
MGSGDRKGDDRGHDLVQVALDRHEVFSVPG